MYNNLNSYLSLSLRLCFLFLACFPSEFLPLRRWAEFHTEPDAPFVGFVST